MTEYPGDIMKAANDLADKHYVDKESVVREIIAAAILAERERCAKVCERVGYDGGDDGYNNWPSHCASEIRKGGTQ